MSAANAETIKISGKGNKERIVYFGSICSNLLNLYLKNSYNKLNINNLGNKSIVNDKENSLPKGYLDANTDCLFRYREESDDFLYIGQYQCIGEAYLTNKTSDNSEYAVREFLKNNNFKITNEMIVYEDDHYYTIIVAEHGDNDYDEYDLLYGPILRREKSINFLDMLNKKADKLYEIIQKYENKDDAQYKLLCNQLLELEYIIDN